MKLEYIICDHCGTSVAEETGAIVMRYTDESGAYPAMHLCNDCCDKLLTSPKKPQEAMEGGAKTNSKIDLTKVSTVCIECAKAAGYKPKNKAFNVWMSTCGICGESKMCTNLWHDWVPPKEEVIK